jgi:integrase/recombinase XerD
MDGIGAKDLLQDSREFLTVQVYGMSNLLPKSTNDLMLIQMWLHGRPIGTQQVYQRDVDALLRFAGKSLQQLTLQDLQAYATHISSQSLKDSTKRRKLNAVKSLFSFATKLNYIRFNVAAALRIPKSSPILAGRILRQVEVFKLLNKLEPGLDRALLKLLYGCGLRITEALTLNWEDFSERDSREVQVKVMGKGNKQRVVLVPIQIWMEVEELRGDAPDDSPVFTSCRGRRLERTMAHRIVKQAVAAAGLSEKISAHWLRHAHAQHALSKGAPISLVRDSLGHSSISVTNFYLESNPTDSSSNYLGL